MDSPTSISKKPAPVLVAIAGGSGSGKTWLAEKLERALAPHAVRLSLDEFYFDRSYLSPARRAQLNFDHPRAIDWRAVEVVLRHLLARRVARIPRYDFETHSRLKRSKLLEPKRIILLDGLWVLRRPYIRRLISLSVFLDCPSGTRLSRRLARDLASRGRTRASIEQQFRDLVAPMHTRYVAPQAALADVVLRKPCGPRQIRSLAEQLQRLI